MENQNRKLARQSGSTVLLVAILVALIILIGLAVFFILKQNKEKAAAPVLPAARPNREISTPQRSAEPIGTETRVVEVNEQDIRNFLERWVNAWSQMDIDTYSSMYDRERFVGYLDSKKSGRRELKYDAWMKLKKGTFSSAYWINIQLANVVIKSVGNNMVEVKFEQFYSSPSYEDRGIKMLRLVPNDWDWKIVFEDFKLQG